MLFVFTLCLGLLTQFVYLCINLHHAHHAFNLLVFPYSMFIQFFVVERAICSLEK